MKYLIISLALITASFSCNNPRVATPWELIPNSMKLDPQCSDGVSKCVEQSIATRSWVCPDSALAIQAKKDSIEKKAKKPK